MSDKMTAEQARTFDGHSAANATILTHAAEQRGCQCKPYQDWYTYKRWRAQGMQVQKGEKGTKLGTFIPTYTTDSDTGEKVKTGTRPWTSHVFCRCQVKPVEKRKAS